MPRRQQGVAWMDGLDLLHEVASLGFLPCTCSGDQSRDSCGNHPATLPSQVLPRACEGAGTKTPPPLRELPGVTWRGRVCDEVMNSVMGTWVSRGWGHVKRPKPQVELGQSFIIPLPFTAPTSTKQSLNWGLHKIRKHQGAVAPNRGCVILCNPDKWQRGKKAAFLFCLYSIPSDLLIPRVGLISPKFRI